MAICTASSDQLQPQLTTDGAGGAIITWEDYRNDIDGDIYAQRVDSSGAVVWAVNGEAVCIASKGQQDPWITTDGVGGAIILLSYFGILWYWIRTHDSYQDAIKRGKLIQLLGITVLVVEGNLLCMYFGNPHQIALADLPLPSAEVINITLALGMLLLFLGHYVVASGSREKGR